MLVFFTAIYKVINLKVLVFKMTTCTFVLTECWGGYRGEDYSLLRDDVVEIGMRVAAHSVWYLRRLEFSMGPFSVYVIL
jgi:hypothetical protein